MNRGPATGVTAIAYASAATSHSVPGADATERRSRRAGLPGERSPSAQASTTANAMPQAKYAIDRGSQLLRCGR